MNKKKAYVVGTNVSTSLSPTIFEYWFKKYKIDAEYGFIEIKEEKFDQEIKTILKKEDLVGINITMPFKEKIVPHLTKIDTSDAIEKSLVKDYYFCADAVNCVTIKKNQLIGKNTDWTGFGGAYFRNSKKNYESDFVIPKEYRTALVFGYGGAGKAATFSLLRNILWKQIIVCNRTFEKIKTLQGVYLPTPSEKSFFSYDDHNDALVKKHLKEGLNFKDRRKLGSEGLTFIDCIKTEEIPKHINKADLAINTTPTNPLKGFENLKVKPHCEGFDIVYRPREGTGFLKHFKKDNRIEGIYMLVHQAAPCFKEWFGIEPETEDVGLYKKLFEKMNQK